MNKSSKYIILTFVLGLFLFGFWQSCQAVDLLLDYPRIEGIKLGEGEAATLPGVIKYIYLFALGAAGFVALLAMLIGAIMYIFSAGNPSKAADAKDRILSAILGIIILLASVLILRTINPNLVEFGLPSLKITPKEDGGDGNGKYACYYCCYWEIFGKCDPYQPEYKRWCLDVTESWAKTECYSEAKFKCNKTLKAYVAKVVQESCE